ncbi:MULTISPECIES: DUF2892 domain-containing protein [unclassified Rhodococcus (in: high G+C Gram-positive bacteria)]|uniref:YgaP family membrane protein n=1 Tax=unclassified Rhodococcus (in: high G+C Gram-positive bacteria) TaxID=192944 RepID=UPI00289705C0|nr:MULTISPECIES: DUF2892 domain-containing protein [unclassified Rhodococcus (in: high G+C Gram-positive bacteria)]
MECQRHPAERIARIIIGVAGGVFVIAGGASVWGVVLAALLILAGLDLAGSTGHCPLYQRLGHVPASLKGGTP